MIATLTISAIALYFGDKILEHFIQEEIWYKRIWLKIFPPRTFKDELCKTIQETINEYESSHLCNESIGKFPFYHSQLLIDILSQHILFDKKQSYSIDDIQNECEKNPNIIRPTQQELDDFYSLFISKIKNNQELSRLYIEENYKKRIYDISGTTSTILDILLKTELTPDIVFNEFQKQTKYQIEKQKRSGKYIPKTFIETNELKDHLRYFAAPFIFIDKVYEEIRKMQFNHLNRKLKLRKSDSKFDFNITDFPIDEIKQSCDKFNSLVEFINDKYTVLEKMGYNEAWATSRKVKRKLDDLEFMLTKIIIIKDNAGQGKTNLLCDFAETVLLKRDIPSLFFTGYEMDANDIFTSIVKRLFPDKNYTFNDVFSRIENYCEDNDTLFLLLIDGLNENSNPQVFSQQLEQFVTEVLKYNHIKIILSCRTEYYKNNFDNLSNATFKDLLMSVDNLNRRLERNQKRRLYETYLSYFKITITDISKDVYEQLVDNFLLLRIFSEAYQGQNIPHLYHIYKDELFQKYYDTECDAINQRLSNNEFPNKVNIANFFKLMIQYMIEHNCYENVPLDVILCKEPQNKDLYIRFLDENILVRKDLDKQDGVFGNRELVNFTFDEFRDFLITDYLLREVYPQNSQDFENFLNNIDAKSRIKEGCISFLFSMERKMNNQSLSDVIRKQAWYQDVFPYYIFDIQDSYVTETDKIQLKQVFLNSTKITKQITLSLAYQRWDEELFPNLNIKLLFEILNKLTDEQFKNVYSIYPIQGHSYYDDSEYNWKHKDLEKIIETLDREFDSQKYGHNLFLYILYFAPLSHNVGRLYKRHWDKFKMSEHLRCILSCKSPKIKDNVNQFLERYAIQL